eukprot:14599713-Alexandrium_andersonii.AAC.1
MHKDECTVQCSTKGARAIARSSVVQQATRQFAFRPMKGFTGTIEGAQLARLEGCNPPARSRAG